MKTKTKIAATVCALALTAGIGIPALAASNRPVPSDMQARQRIELTEEQRAELEARRAEMSANMLENGGFDRGNRSMGIRGMKGEAPAN